MFRNIITSAPFALTLAGIPSLVSAQHQREPIQVDTPVRNAGVLDYSTGTWKAPQQLSGIAPTVIYDNTCIFTGGSFFAPLGADCAELYEEGRIPTTDLSDPFAAGLADPSLLCDCYFLTSFQFAYCTDQVTPANGGVATVAVQIGFIEGPAVSGIGGDCMNFAGQIASASPPSGAPANLGLPPANFGGPHDVFIDLFTAGLPGGPGGGVTECWTLTVDLSNTGGGGPRCSAATAAMRSPTAPRRRAVRAAWRR